METNEEQRVTMFAGIENATRLPAGPVASLDFRRVQALPRRDWQTVRDLDEAASILTSEFRVAGGTWKLKPLQAAALVEMRSRSGGLFGPIVVGGGKTLITLLAPWMVDCRQPVLLVPASLRDQTVEYVLPEVRKQFHIHPGLRIVGYSELSLAKNATMLDRLAPDLIIADECHLLKELTSGRTKRVARYMRNNPRTRFVALSGTITNHSIMDYWHIVQWALKPADAPVPSGFHEAKEWSKALDERVPDYERTGPGCLAQLCSMGETARSGYRRRLVETPGIIATSEEALGVSLLVRGIRNLEVPAVIQALVASIQGSWELPDGEVLQQAMDVWRHLQTAVQGFFYSWDPAPPEEWLAARKEWHRYVAYRLKTNRSGLDTPLQVWNEVEAQTKDTMERRTFLAYRAIKDTYRPVSVPTWMSDYLTRAAMAWMQDGPGIVWVTSRAFGERLATLSKAPYFGAGDSRILAEDGKRVVIASIAAHGTGKNLQKWSRSLVTCPPTRGSVWEQLLGRTHRMGQEADSVEYDVFQHHKVYRESMEQAIADSRFLQEAHGNSQRLIYCDKVGLP